ncbi:MAG TPA: SpoIIE family protein phosphatase [Actinomycetota bacterium]|nr:SpoIIE family protein phosphatase [Actinomycetota bacterium]
MRVSLRLKIVGGFGSLLLLMAVLGWVTLSLFGSIRTVQQEVFDDAIPGLVAVDEIVRSYTAQSAAVRGALIESAPAVLLAQYRSEVETARFWETRAKPLFTSAEERELLEDLVRAGHSFQDLVDDQVIPLSESGQRSRAFRVLGQDGTTLISEIERLGGLLRDGQREVVIQSESDVRSNTNRTIYILVAVLIGAFALAILLTVYLPRRLVGNLQQLVETARAIGRGDFDQNIGVRSRDEVGELAARMGEMQQGLKRLQQLALHDRELEIAASIQRNLLQRQLPEVDAAQLVPLQRQANLVGGDWYDVDVQAGTMTIAVGDASGKGIAAALMATVALSALRGERSRGGSPKHVIAAANQALLDVTDPESFTTVIYASLKLATGECRWMNMGHHPPFLLRARTAENPTPRGYYLEGPRNRALGWYDDPGLAETVVHLAPGDRLVLFTDGFLEAKSPEGEVFGDHRLAETFVKLASLDSAVLGEELVAVVEQFAAGKLDDDLTMLVIDYRGAAPVGSGADEGAEEETWRSRR